MSFLRLFESLDTTPVIRFYPEGIVNGRDDEPAKLRWRGHWDARSDDVISIAVQAYPVVRTTTCGAWIDPDAYVQATRQPWEEGAPGYDWVLSGTDLKWVSNDGSQAWAKQTREEAIFSLAVRLSRWAGRLHQERARCRAAAESLAILRPDLKRFSREAMERLESEK